MISNPIENAHVNTTKTSVDSGVAAPVAWTDLDLSAHIGTRAATVFLKVKQTTADDLTPVRFRTNGEVDDSQSNHLVAAGAGQGNVEAANRWILVVVVTDSAGIIEWIASNAQDYEIFCLAFIYED